MRTKTLIAAIAIAGAGSAMALHLAAQDVTVTPLEWVEPKDAPDQLPVENHALKPDFPSDLRNTPDPGYVVYEFFADEKGKRLGGRTVATLAAYDRAVMREIEFWKLKPGRRQGSAVNTYARCVVLFNPASADPRKPDATPRLLHAAAVVDPSRQARKDAPPAPPEVVWATVGLDAQGGLTGLKDAPPGLAPLLERTLREFRFAPARRGGAAVAAELRVPFVVVPPGVSFSGEAKPPRLVSSVRPVYPQEMRASGLRGEVLVDLVVDREGRATNAYVVRSLNPAFDEPALESVRQWKFEPGRQGGVPVNTHMRVPIIFRLEGVYEGGDSGLEVKAKVKQSELPAEFRYDVAPKPRGILLPVYPYALLRDEVAGKARVRFVIGANGKVLLSEVESADRPEFGAALRAAIECYEFEPALKDGRPTQAVFALEQKFSLDDGDRVVTHEDRELVALEHKHPERIISPNRLDAKLQPISRRPPAFPLSLSGEVAKGEAVVELLVDEEGRARLPRVVSASDPAFGWAAVQAVAVWRFEPPKSGGQSAIVRVRVPFLFSGRQPAPKAP